MGTASRLQRTIRQILSTRIDLYLTCSTELWTGHRSNFILPRVLRLLSEISMSSHYKQKSVHMGFLCWLERGEPFRILIPVWRSRRSSSSRLDFDSPIVVRIRTLCKGTMGWDESTIIRVAHEVSNHQLLRLPCSNAKNSGTFSALCPESSQKLVPNFMINCVRASELCIMHMRAAICSQAQFRL